MTKDWNNIKVPTYTNIMAPQSVKVTFRFDDPKVTDKGDYKSYNWGVYDEHGKEGNLSGFDGLYKALNKLAGVPGNDDGTGGPLQAYTVQKGTVVAIGCYQKDLNNNKTKLYGATWISGPVKLTASVPAQQQAAPPPAQPQPPPPQQGVQQPMISKQQVERSKTYTPLTDVKIAIMEAMVQDEIFTLAHIISQIKAQFPDIKEEQAHAWATHINITVRQEIWRYDSLAEPEPEPTPPPTNDPVYLRIAAIPLMPDKGQRIAEFFDACVQHTSTDSHHSAKATLKKFGVNNLPTGSTEDLWKVFNILQVYRSYRDQGFESDAAVAATAHDLGLTGLADGNQPG